jgi:hypothetical protein
MNEKVAAEPCLAGDEVVVNVESPTEVEGQRQRLPEHV